MKHDITFTFEFTQEGHFLRAECPHVGTWLRWNPGVWVDADSRALETRPGIIDQLERGAGCFQSQQDRQQRPMPARGQRASGGPVLVGKGTRTPREKRANGRNDHV